MVVFKWVYIFDVQFGDYKIQILPYMYTRTYTLCVKTVIHLRDGEQNGVRGALHMARPSMPNAGIATQTEGFEQKRLHAETIRDITTKGG